MLDSIYHMTLKFKIVFFWLETQFICCIYVTLL